MPLNEASVPGPPPKGPHNDLRETFERFFLHAKKRSESGGVSVPGVFESRVGNISRHFRGEKDITMTDRSRSFHVEEGQTSGISVTGFPYFLIRMTQESTTPCQFPVNLSHVCDVLD